MPTGSLGDRLRHYGRRRTSPYSPGGRSSMAGNAEEKEFLVSRCLVCQFLLVAQSTQTARKSASLWCRPQRDVHVFCRIRIELTWTKTRREDLLSWPRSVRLPSKMNWLDLWTRDLASFPHLGNSVSLSMSLPLFLFLSLSVWLSLSLSPPLSPSLPPSTSPLFFCQFVATPPLSLSPSLPPSLPPPPLLLPDLEILIPLPPPSVSVSLCLCLCLPRSVSVCLWLSLSLPPPPSLSLSIFLSSLPLSLPPLSPSLPLSPQSLLPPLPLSIPLSPPLYPPLSPFLSPLSPSLSPSLSPLSPLPLSPLSHPPPPSLSQSAKHQALDSRGPRWSHLDTLWFRVSEVQSTWQ